MLSFLRTIAWIACVVYSTIPSFWLLIHPRADHWRSRRASPYRILLPTWVAMWAGVALITAPWRNRMLYHNRWTWLPAGVLFLGGIALYKLSRYQFSLAQLGGLPEILRGRQQQRLSTTGIRARVRHPVYLGHLCEMLAWSVGSGLAICWALTAFTIVTGGFMIKAEDRELEKRFGEQYRTYRLLVPALVPKVKL